MYLFEVKYIDTLIVNGEDKEIEGIQYVSAENFQSVYETLKYEMLVANRELVSIRRTVPICQTISGQPK